MMLLASPMVVEDIGTWMEKSIQLLNTLKDTKDTTCICRLTIKETVVYSRMLFPELRDPSV